MSEPVFWRTRSGSLINVDDMTIDHLRNTLKMIIRQANARKQGNAVRFQLNGDMAKEFNDSYFENEDECDASELDLY